LEEDGEEEKKKLTSNISQQIVDLFALKLTVISREDQKKGEGERGREGERGGMEGGEGERRKGRRGGRGRGEPQGKLRLADGDGEALRAEKPRTRAGNVLDFEQFLFALLAESLIALLIDRKRREQASVEGTIRNNPSKEHCSIVTL